jgi:hypothetical protein
MSTPTSLALVKLYVSEELADGGAGVTYSYYPASGGYTSGSTRTGVSLSTNRDIRLDAEGAWGGFLGNIWQIEDKRVSWDIEYNPLIANAMSDLPTGGSVIIGDGSGAFENGSVMSATIPVLDIGTNKTVFSKQLSYLDERTKYMSAQERANYISSEMANLKKYAGLSFDYLETVDVSEAVPESTLANDLYGDYSDWPRTKKAAATFGIGRTGILGGAIDTFAGLPVLGASVVDAVEGDYKELSGKAESKPFPLFRTTGVFASLGAGLADLVNIPRRIVLRGVDKIPVNEDIKTVTKAALDPITRTEITGKMLSNVVSSFSPSAGNTLQKQQTWTKQFIADFSDYLGMHDSNDPVTAEELGALGAVVATMGLGAVAKAKFPAIKAALDSSRYIPEESLKIRFVEGVTDPLSMKDPLGNLQYISKEYPVQTAIHATTSKPFVKNIRTVGAEVEAITEGAKSFRKDAGLLNLYVSGVSDTGIPQVYKGFLGLADSVSGSTSKIVRNPKRNILVFDEAIDQASVFNRMSGMQGTIENMAKFNQEYVLSGKPGLKATAENILSAGRYSYERQYVIPVGAEILYDPSALRIIKMVENPYKIRKVYRRMSKLEKRYTTFQEISAELDSKVPNMFKGSTYEKIKKAAGDKYIGKDPYTVVETKPNPITSEKIPKTVRDYLNKIRDTAFTKYDTVEITPSKVKWNKGKTPKSGKKDMLFPEEKLSYEVKSSGLYSSAGAVSGIAAVGSEYLNSVNKSVNESLKKVSSIKSEPVKEYRSKPVSDPDKSFSDISKSISEKIKSASKSVGSSKKVSSSKGSKSSGSSSVSEILESINKALSSTDKIVSSSNGAIDYGITIEPINPSPIPISSGGSAGTSGSSGYIINVNKKSSKSKPSFEDMLGKFEKPKINDFNVVKNVRKWKIRDILTGKIIKG